MVELQIPNETLDSMEQEVTEEAHLEITDEDLAFIKRPIRFNHQISTGSTLLDLAISGDRIKGGGLPGGVIIEIFGPPSVGKTALAAEISAAVQSKKNKGQVRFADPEARLDTEYSQIFGVDIREDFFDYHRPNTVSDLFDLIINWKPKDSERPNAFVADSLAALSTELELSEKGDSMGMRRGKEFSEGFRKSCRMIADRDWLLVCTNQLRQSQFGTFTPGGEAIKYYSSVRLSLFPGKPHMITRKKRIKITGAEDSVDIETTIGIYTTVKVEKNSIDMPKRDAPIYIVFGHGIDDIRANLQYVKNMLKLNTYRAVDRNYVAIADAIHYIEKNKLTEALKEETIRIWNEASEQLKEKRLPKVR